MSIVDKSAQPAQAPPARTLDEVYAAVAQLRGEVAALRESLVQIALYAPKDPEAHLPEACRQHECEYYRHYLAYGGPDLTHEGYHAAEKIAEHHFAWCGSIRNDRGPCAVCLSHEQRLRAEATGMSRSAQQWDAASILALRLQSGCTQEEKMAAALGVRQQTISEWETDRYRPTGRHCKVLNLFAERAAKLEES